LQTDMVRYSQRKRPPSLDTGLTDVCNYSRELWLLGCGLISALSGGGHQTKNRGGPAAGFNLSGGGDSPEKSTQPHCGPKSIRVVCVVYFAVIYISSSELFGRKEGRNLTFQPHRGLCDTAF
jgi:hypothetical protein